MNDNLSYICTYHEDDNIRTHNESIYIMTWQYLEQLRIKHNCSEQHQPRIKNIAEDFKQYISSLQLNHTDVKNYYINAVDKLKEYPKYHTIWQSFMSLQLLL